MTREDTGAQEGSYHTPPLTRCNPGLTTPGHVAVPRGIRRRETTGSRGSPVAPSKRGICCETCQTETGKLHDRDGDRCPKWESEEVDTRTDATPGLHWGV